MHYLHRMDAAVNVHDELVRRGWVAYDYTEDRSDSQTDYFAPAHWEGIAEKGGYIACINVASSGGGTRWRRQNVKGDTCLRCGGDCLEPNGWTIEEAKAAPETYSRHRAAVLWPGSMPLYPLVVGPGDFDDNGRERCPQCCGRGYMWKAGVSAEPRPDHQANPKGCTWHVERGGRILAKGTGLSACYDGNDHLPDRALAVRVAVRNLCDRIGAACGKPAPVPTAKAGRRERQTAPTIKEPDAPATKSQLFYLHCLSKSDTRGLTLTKAQASALIERARAGENVLPLLQATQ
jgi:hypothetical protein